MPTAAHLDLDELRRRQGLRLAHTYRSPGDSFIRHYQIKDMGGELLDQMKLGSSHGIEDRLGDLLVIDSIPNVIRLHSPFGIGIEFQFNPDGLPGGAFGAMHTDYRLDDKVV